MLAVIFRRIIKVLYFYGLNLVLIVYLLRNLGRGPIWHLWDKVMSSAALYDLLFINNLTQHECLPWLWFFGVYIQLSILAPLAIYVMKKNAFISYPLIVILSIVSATVVGL